MGRFIRGFLLGVLLVFGTLVAIGHALRVEDPLAKVDVIVAPSGDGGARARTAAALYQEGYAPLIIFSGGSDDPAAPSSAEVMKRQAVLAGVPPSAIIVEGRSATTEENAQFVAEIIKARDLRSAILVTSPYHQRRASMLFIRALEGTAVTLRNYPARESGWDPNLWWASEPSRGLTVVEIIKLATDAAQAGISKASEAPTVR